MPDAVEQYRTDVLQSMGARGAVLAELLRYNESHFDVEQAKALSFPLASEEFYAWWSGYPPAGDQLWAQLSQDFPQLSFPVSSGMSSDPSYLSATRSGSWQASTTALGLRAPGLLRLHFGESPAGSIPILVTTDRADFALLVQALSKRNEPSPIPLSMGACMIAGLNNWGRVRSYRRSWEANLPSPVTEQEWKSEMARLTSRKELYQDRLILLSDGPYSAVTADQLGIAETEWRTCSLAIRWGHECAHYFTRRVFGSMRNNLLDELIADYSGIRRALGTFRSSWLLRFIGLEDYPQYRQGARFENYCGSPSLSEEAILIVRTLVYRSALNLEQFDRVSGESGVHVSVPAMLALASSTLEELADQRAPQTLAARVAALRTTERISIS